jgi:hypothetical protein
MGDFWDSFTGAASDIWGGITGAASDVFSGITGIFGDEGSAEGIFDSLPSVDIPGFGGGDFGPQAGPADVVMGSDGMNGNGDGGMVQAAWPAAAAAGAISLGALLARTFGRGAAGAIFTAANGVRVRMGQLWPLVRRYGSQAVAGGLGLSAGSLATLLMTPEALHGRSGRKGRGRGISARDVKTTRRTLKQIRRIYGMMPKRATSWGGGGGYRPRSYRRAR